MIENRDGSLSDIMSMDTLLNAIKENPTTLENAKAIHLGTQEELERKVEELQKNNLEYRVNELEKKINKIMIKLGIDEKKEGKMDVNRIFGNSGYINSDSFCKDGNHVFVWAGDPNFMMPDDYPCACGQTKYGDTKNYCPSCESLRAEVERLKEEKETVMDNALSLLTSSLCDIHREEANKLTFSEFYKQNKGKCLHCIEKDNGELRERLKGIEG